MTKSKATGTLLTEQPLDFRWLPRPIASRLKHHNGYAYVVELTNGMVKVGMTTKPRRRLGQHRAEGKLHGYELSRLWISPAHEGAQATEAQLVEYGNANGRSVGDRLEYFEGVDFDDVVTFACGLELKPAALDDDGMSDREVKAITNGAYANLATYMTESGDPKLIDTARRVYVGMAFGEGFFHDYDLPEEIDKASPAEIVERVRGLAEAMGIPPIRLLDLNWIDTAEETIITMARSAASRLRMHAVENGLHHLIDPHWAFVDWPEGHEQIPCCVLFGPGACDHSDEPEGGPDAAEDDHLDVGLRKILEGS